MRVTERKLTEILEEQGTEIRFPRAATVPLTATTTKRNTGQNHNAKDRRKGQVRALTDSATPVTLKNTGGGETTVATAVVRRVLTTMAPFPADRGTVATAWQRWSFGDGFRFQPQISVEFSGGLSTPTPSENTNSGRARLKGNQLGG
ncbi:hypothetical protein PIB30_086516 [Stylosanthes scabra]|uniref:Uncharacterized protein n=1 Tax=Stylosanthes scabra TaxID=79078 RepID=A0ABU6VV60_9FABA|nr:hypothetical protein [Stylosanthes scabra]